MEKKQERRKPQQQEQQQDKGVTFVTEYTHYRSGKRMRAADYGYKAWPFGKGRS